MTANRELIFYHAPQSRSTGVLTLLEELAADYEIKVLNMKAGDLKKPQYLALNHMGKVPALVHGGALVTEQSAIYIYLADLYSNARLAPAIHDPLRGPYLRWMIFYSSCFEPAIVDRSLKREPAPPSMSPYGDFDTMFETLVGQLGQGDYLLGETFSAVDVLWGSALAWITRFQLIPALPVIQHYLERVNARPAFIWAKAKDLELAAGFE